MVAGAAEVLNGLDAHALAIACMLRGAQADAVRCLVKAFHEAANSSPRESAVQRRALERTIACYEWPAPIGDLLARSAEAAGKLAMTVSQS